MKQTPLSERLRVVLAGPRNAGKSSLMNALFKREVALVSDVPGTTTDPVTRAFEIPGLGPAAVTDTPGIDDVGELGMQRVRLALQRAAEADLLVLVTPAHKAPGKAETALFEQWFPHAASSSGSSDTGYPATGSGASFSGSPSGGGDSPLPSGTTSKSFGQPEANARRKKPAILVLTHADKEIHASKAAWSNAVMGIHTVAPQGRGIDALVAGLASARPEREIGPLEGLAGEGDLVLLVTPIDLAAPAGRLIGPQVQTIRDALDRDAAALIVKERELRAQYSALAQRPRLVITDSQAFSKVAADIPGDQALTSFSILFARKKGDLNRFIEGLERVAHCPAEPRILVLESCSHHRQADDIGTVRIPRLFRQMVRDDAEFSFERGLPDSESLQNYDMVIHCGACRMTRSAMTVRLDHLAGTGVPVTNYGLFLAWANGLMPRALEPFGDAMETWKTIFETVSTKSVP